MPHIATIKALIAAFLVSGDSTPDMRTYIDSLVAQPHVSSASWGIVIFNPRTSDTLYSLNAGKNLVPASSLKAVTGATALARLGTNFRYRTAFVATGPVRDSILYGNLDVYGVGDPTISDRMRGNAAATLRAIADSLPFKAITGHVRSARNTFPDSPLGYGWAWSDLSEGYAAGVDELLFNEGQPPSSEPSMKFIEVFGNALRARGIRISDGTVSDSRVDTVFTLVSPPLSAILPAMLKPSQNQIAEMLLKTLGNQITGVGTADSGAAVISRQLLTWGAPPMGFLIRDGSGLSRNNLLSAETLGRVLGAMYTDTVFYNSLPIGSVDGTLRNRFSGTLAAGNVRAKSGAVANVRSLAGYVDTRSGQRLAFVICTNNYTVPGADILSIIDKIVLRLI